MSNNQAEMTPDTKEWMPDRKNLLIEDICRQLVEDLKDKLEFELDGKTRINLI